MKKPTPDVYQDKRFSTPQIVYNRKGKAVAQVSVDDYGEFWLRRLNIKDDDWGDWYHAPELF